MSSISQNVLKVKSNAFNDGELIPVKYTCEGENINPQLEISGYPQGTKTLLLIMEDPDAPHGTFYHWLIWNILPEQAISENSSPGISGKNSAGKTGYRGPCPPSGTHRYFFKFYALDTSISLSEDADFNMLKEAMYGHVIGEGKLMGKYEKKSI